MKYERYITDENEDTMRGVCKQLQTYTYRALPYLPRITEIPSCCAAEAVA